MLISVASGHTTPDASAANTEAVKSLAEEVASLGWIGYGARTEKGDWDLFVCRPDGSKIHPLTRTPKYNEFSPQFTRDGTRLLYRRIPREESIDNNRHGEQGELVVARSNGADPVVLGQPGEFPWASWNPEATRIACLSIGGITLVDVSTKSTVRHFLRKGFFQQLVWSPDGRWFLGVANSYGASWSIARMNVASGNAEAVNRIDCCTPDWFPDSQHVVFSWRPPGQTANDGYGWTELWMATADGKNRRLLYGEEGRHLYGGQVSPDGRYVLFTGNMNEDGDPGSAGAPMGLMRLSDAPIIAGNSRELRRRHRDANDGPVLTLPAGWEPDWTLAEILPIPAPNPDPQSQNGDQSQAVSLLSHELHDKGWLVFSAKTQTGTWDLIVMRPDGSDRRQITSTREWHEAGARFSPDGSQLLYYRIPTTESVDNNTYGTFELVLANADGRHPSPHGSDIPWAAWSPDSHRLACLKPDGIIILDPATKTVIRKLPRHGIVQQLAWSPDGNLFAGTANGLGPYWNVGRLNIDSGQIHPISETDRYNCTPDWHPDSQRVLYSRGIIPEKGGWAELWVGSTRDTPPKRLYAETARHIYGACTSPDGQYILFTRSVEDLGRVDHSKTTLAIIRWRDTPMVVAENPHRQRSRSLATGPRLDLGPGWEPHWTAAEISPAQEDPPDANRTHAEN